MLRAALLAQRTPFRPLCNATAGALEVCCKGAEGGPPGCHGYVTAVEAARDAARARAPEGWLVKPASRRGYLWRNSIAAGSAFLAKRQVVLRLEQWQLGHSLGFPPGALVHPGSSPGCRLLGETPRPSHGVHLLGFGPSGDPLHRGISGVSGRPLVCQSQNHQSAAEGPASWSTAVRGCGKQKRKHLSGPAWGSAEPDSTTGFRANTPVTRCCGEPADHSTSNVSIRVNGRARGAAASLQTSQPTTENLSNSECPSEEAPSQDMTMSRASSPLSRVAALVLKRLVTSVTTIPSLSSCLHTVALLAAASVPIALSAVWASAFSPAHAAFDPLVLLKAVFIPCLAEELLWRAALLPSPVFEKTKTDEALFWVTLSTLIYVLAHPLLAYAIRPQALALFGHPGFMLCCALLGTICAVSYRSSGSVWTAVFLHWAVVAVWLSLGGRQKAPL